MEGCLVPSRRDSFLVSRFDLLWTRLPFDRLYSGDTARHRFPNLCFDRDRACLCNVYMVFACVSVDDDECSSLTETQEGNYSRRIGR